MLPASGVIMWLLDRLDSDIQIFIDENIVSLLSYKRLKTFHTCQQVLHLCCTISSLRTAKLFDYSTA